MADYDRRPRRGGGGGGGGGGGQFNNRKRRYRGTNPFLKDPSVTFLIRTEDDYDDRRPQRRRYEEPLAVSLRKQVLSIAENVCELRAFYVHFVANCLVADQTG